ncbi:MULTISPECIES: UbiH/UbiF/VisC/COQ6 family ubiquinone biosynthesis hydroxylase [Acetobacter]|uniref:Ubiquinone biosynthesis hydroxylase UbiH/UbiF/VisC/COQ6 n=1 Tax=Acetobacter tropicalis NBRC 101654 TaxID=749388 RepID=F7VIN4_9PROT|nr:MULTISPECIES: UbiH/UbiF/VisC/COQ6 family ubiquinone biosynthesis hydroxylase [Acetobacter]MCC6105612.1 UbiH/UbiF/VisC/COQ6 family ubiquinone biosynthesis hydroxylase [Acetobacter sp.]MCG4252593.1 UbiH/UbiF/VisC/COQ6 family ubiquinone biosynthesis hydroxylase [Acetobacter senegalensis]MCG4259331.1 UbiH/UbiF/VisC/COQ6 family ubiquinone biosynthesis hydroxylase [Acetobacter senegalensis]MCP1196850.1 UbiH/UbiF/VisC/COQ6 family ubiquinone biosynthesis hydroxylase [Acetobacter senegalensis]MDN735
MVASTASAVHDTAPAGQMLPDVDVCIVGAGPVGATLACRLAKEGITVAIIDRADLPPMEHPDFDGRAYAIAAGPKKLLEEAGVWEVLPLESCPIEDILVTDGRPGEPASSLFLEFTRDDASQPFGWMVEARALRVALNETLHTQPNLTVLAPAEATVERQADGATVRLHDGRTFRASVVVAADGRKSRLRSQAGIPLTKLSYGQTAIVCAIAHEFPHDNGALEHFLPAGPFAQLPMTGTESHPYLSAIVWSDKDGVAERFAALPDEVFAREIERRMGNTRLGKVTPVGRRWTYPLSAQYAQRYTDTRLLLVGDAAHGIHPIAGQGLNLGFRDIIALSDIMITAHAKGEDLGGPALLARYQARCRPANMLMLAATDTLDRLFSNNNPVIRLARDLGIAGVNRFPKLRKAFVRHAMGI